MTAFDWDAYLRAALVAGLTHQEFWDLTPHEVALSIEAYHQREERADWRAAMVASVIANVHRGKRGRPFKPSDFMPRQRRRAQSPEQQARMLRALTRLLGGTVTDGESR